MAGAGLSSPDFLPGPTKPSAAISAIITASGERLDLSVGAAIDVVSYIVRMLEQTWSRRIIAILVSGNRPQPGEAD
jgi:hypothetical protein